MVAAGDKITATDISAVEDATTGKPLVRLVQQSAQSITDSTDTALTFGASSEDIDTHGLHDTASNTSRVTPTTAGYYRVSGTYQVVARTDWNSIACFVAKNGTGVAPRDRVGPNAVSLSRCASASAILSANGTTDYFEVYGFQDNVANAANNTSVGGTVASTLEVEFLRPL